MTSCGARLGPPKNTLLCKLQEQGMQDYRKLSLVLCLIGTDWSLDPSCCPGEYVLNLNLDRFNLPLALLRRCSRRADPNFSFFCAINFAYSCTNVLPGGRKSNSDG